MMLSGGFADRKHTYHLASVSFFVRSAKNLRAVEVQLLNQKSVSFFDYRVRKNIRAKRIVMTQVPTLTSLILPVKILMKT